MKKQPICLFLLGIFFSISPVFSQPPLSAKDEIAIRHVLATQETCWNTGDLECFMEGYWKSDSLAFIGKSGITQGWKATLANYKRGYPDKATMGKLTFTIIRMEKLSSKSALVLGKFHLDREKLDNLEGYFSLTWRKVKGTWVIVVDHTSG